MDTFKAETAIPLQMQIADHLAQRIISGELPDRARLPSTVELAKLYNVTPVTVHKSLQRLVKRRLIERRSREGTFVCSQERTNVIALVFGKSPFSHPGNFYTSLLSLFQREAYARELNFKVYFDFETSGKTRFDLEQDVRSGELKGLIVTNGGPLLAEFLKAYPEILRCNPASFDFKDEARRSVSYLIERGYRHIGVLSMHPEVLENEYFIRCHEAECRGVWEAVGDSGVRVEIRRCDHTEVAGYRKMKEWLRDPLERPRAFFINHDIMVHGTLLAIAEAGLKIPEDVALLVHMNGENEFPSPVPLSKYKVNVKQMVTNCLDSLGEAMEKEKPGVIPLPIVPGEIEPGNSCGENNPQP